MHSNTTNIRMATDADAASIIGFQKAMALETEGLELRPETLARGVEAVLNDPGKGTYYVAEGPEGVIASLMITREWSDWRNGWVWWIQSVYVLPGYRGKGVYAAMYAFLKEIVERNTDALGLRLYVDQRNALACRVYERLGMNGDHYSLYEWMP
jgi:GNAT superfamily N-acetyltransferase